ncbi:MAG TPA: diaminopimelate decarboxylase [Anaerolineae bacterium]|nr:diaminopimelate decarboxylase [Anaerolineae bacterium]
MSDSIGPDLLAERLRIFPQTTRVDDDLGLMINGVGVAQLADRYGTPLYLYDEATIADALGQYRNGLAAYGGETGVTYAGKAYLSLALIEWLVARGVWIDCTGLGELGLAVASGAPREQILVHGVNKTTAVLRQACQQAGTIVIDNLAELERLLALVVAGPRPALWLRYKPDEMVVTHHHIQTGQEDSKFGLRREEVVAAVNRCREAGWLVTGLHFHLGSQFREAAPLAVAVGRVLDLAVTLELPAEWVLCPGGGLGMAYHEEALPQPDIVTYVRQLGEWVVAGCAERGLPLPRLQLEPGRSLVARAGVAVYQVGGVKRTRERRWVLVDGGLADNARFALYGARYTALPVERPRRPMGERATIAGPFCESGDILIEHLWLADVAEGELLAVPMSGAYHLSMGSNYNGALKPAVIWLCGGEARLMQARERVADLLRRERLVVAEGDLLWAGIPMVKYEAWGNDYLVLKRADVGRELTVAEIRRLCDRHVGVGADGILWDVSDEGGGRVRIFNVDGSEAEKSGNGLAIFGRYLRDEGVVEVEERFVVGLPSEEVAMVVAGDGGLVTVDVGQVMWVEGRGRIGLWLEGLGEEVWGTAISVGNPHWVMLAEEEEGMVAEIKRLGRWVEVAERFERGTNVQLVAGIGPNRLRLEIWERGVGYTLASGSSACAAAAAAWGWGLVVGDKPIEVLVAGGGILLVEISENDARVRLTTRVRQVWRGRVSDEMWADR